jgi:integrase
MLRSSHDPRTTPFLERLADVRRVYLGLPDRLRLAFALGAYGGLRPGEAWALRWQHVDLAARRIHVRESVGGPTKDKDSRLVPILDALLPMLQPAHLAAGGQGYVCPSLRRDGGRAEDNTRGRQLQATLRDLGLARDGLGWYEATRHTFASQWAMAGGDLRRLQAILGHSSITITERYAHLRPEAFTARDLSMIPGELEFAGDVVRMEKTE